MTDASVRIGRAALHFWEEPCISGKQGAGAIFFTGCNLRCVFCQNSKISTGMVGKEFSVEELSECMLSLQDQSAVSIDLVTPTHFVEPILEAIEVARDKGLRLPIVYNSSGYETVSTLKKLKGVVQVYMPDFKYFSPALALRYSKAEDYPQIVSKALAEMVEQTGPVEFDDQGLMKKGVLVRHLVLPGCVNDSKQIVKYLLETYGNQIYISLMNQYTPFGNLEQYPEINRKVTRREYEKLVNYAIDLGLENGFIQEGETCSESFIPEFGEGELL